MGILFQLADLFGLASSTLDNKPFRSAASALGLADRMLVFRALRFRIGSHERTLCWSCFGSIPQRNLERLRCRCGAQVDADAREHNSQPSCGTPKNHAAFRADGSEVREQVVSTFCGCLNLAEWM